MLEPNFAQRIVSSGGPPSWLDVDGNNLKFVFIFFSRSAVEQELIEGSIPSFVFILFC